MFGEEYNPQQYNFATERSERVEFWMGTLSQFLSISELPHTGENWQFLLYVRSQQ
jgi:hypothetical protein